MFRAWKTDYWQNGGGRSPDGRGLFCTFPATTNKAVSSLCSGSVLGDGRGISVHQ